MRCESVLGVALAGGASRRMGFDKRFLEVDGVSLVRRALEALSGCCAEVAVSVQAGAADAGGSGLGTRRIEDLRVDQGPLAGLEAALIDASGDDRSVLLLACDLPHVDVRLLEHVLGAARRARALAVVPSLEARPQPLCAWYAPACLPTVRRSLDAGRRAMRDVLLEIPAVEVPITPELPFYRPDVFRNLNRPADLEAVAADLR